MTRRLAALLALCAAWPAAAQNYPTVSPHAALNHIGQRVSVCGRIVPANFVGGSTPRPPTGITPPGSPPVTNQSVLLAYDFPFPGQVFSLLIPAIDRIKFG